MRPSNQENGRSGRCCPFISFFSFTRFDPRNYGSRVVFLRGFFLLFYALLQKLIAEDVVTYVYLNIALSKPI
jgi:hypothetical protein